MDKSTKLYKYAMEKYQNGYIDEAIEACEKSISLNMKNSAAINLKGLLLYLKGDLNNSRSIWKLNKDVNKDSVSKKYIESSLKDEEKLRLYEASLELIKEIRINEALKLLESCCESDFNCINVGNAISSCYIKQGEYNRALEYINKVLDLDKRNKLAIENKKMLIQYGIIKRKIEYKKIIVALGIVVVLSSVVYLCVSNREKIANWSGKFILNDKISSPKEEKNISEPIKKIEINKEEKKEEQVLKLENDSKQKESKEKEVFPTEEIKGQLEKKNYEELYKQYAYWKDKVGAINEKSLIGSVEEVLKSEGTRYFYSLGNQYIKELNNDKAIDSLRKSQELGKNSELYPYIIFSLASAYEKVSDFENALKLYEEYHLNYASGDYGDEVLNRMAMIYRNIDKNKAKIYAEELIKRYPKSIYNNSKIKAILNGE